MISDSNFAKLLQEVRQMKKTLKMLIGLALVILGVYLMILWQFFVWTLIKGGLGLFIILIGLITMAVAGE
jgi:hypothetical protein